MTYRHLSQTHTNTRAQSIAVCMHKIVTVRVYFVGFFSLNSRQARILSVCLSACVFFSDTNINQLKNNRNRNKKGSSYAYVSYICVVYPCCSCISALSTSELCKLLLHTFFCNFPLDLLIVVVVVADERR